MTPHASRSLPIHKCSYGSLNGIQEVASSILVGSTILNKTLANSGSNALLDGQKSSQSVMTKRAQYVGYMSVGAPLRRHAGTRANRSKALLVKAVEEESVPIESAFQATVIAAGILLAALLALWWGS